MDKKDQNTETKQNQPSKKIQKNKKSYRKIDSIDIDKMEYQQIVLSQSNFPDRY